MYRHTSVIISEPLDTLRRKYVLIQGQLTRISRSRLFGAADLARFVVLGRLRRTREKARHHCRCRMRLVAGFVRQIVTNEDWYDRHIWPSSTRFIMRICGSRAVTSNLSLFTARRVYSAGKLAFAAVRL